MSVVFCTKGDRSGRKGRTLKMRVAELDLSVPQSHTCKLYHLSMLSHWQRSERSLRVACAEMYFQGVSTRKVRDGVGGELRIESFVERGESGCGGVG